MYATPEGTQRSGGQIMKTAFQIKSGQRSFYYRTVTLFYALEPHLKFSESLIIFKRKMKAFLFPFSVFNVINFTCILVSSIKFCTTRLSRE